jgi:hypothetical protein
MAASMPTSVSSAELDPLYPLRVLAVGSALWHFRHRYRGLGWWLSWHSGAVGVAVFVVWILLDPTPNASDTPLLQGLRELPGWAAAAWLLFRVLGSVITRLRRFA